MKYKKIEILKKNMYPTSTLYYLCSGTGPSVVRQDLLGQQEEVGVRKLCALFGVALRTGMGSSVGEGLYTCGKRVTVALRRLSPFGGLSWTAHICTGGRTPARSRTLSSRASLESESCNPQLLPLES